MTQSRKKYVYLLIIFLSFILVGKESLAYVAESSNYKIELDSINFGGTEDSSSASYGISDTLGESGTGDSSSSSYNLRAGYRSVELTTTPTSLTLSSPSDISLSEIDLASGGSSEGTASWTVITNNSSGYRLSIKASTDPALQSSGDSFADYTPSGASADFNWSIDSSSAEFGFTPEGGDVVSRYLDNGSSCGVGSNETSSRCWDAFSTSNTTIAEGSSGNTPGGESTTVRVQAEMGSGASLSSGSYSATLTVTAITL